MCPALVDANLDDVISRLPSEKLARTVAARAINRAIIAARTAASKETAKRYALRQGQINARANVDKASSNNPEAVVLYAGGALNIVDYRVTPAQPNPAGRPVLRVTIGKTNGARPSPGSFLIPTRAGAVGGFRRTGEDRYPIRPVFAPSVPQVVSSEGVREAVQERATDVLFTRLDHEINRELDKL